MEQNKICKSCKIEKPITDFYRIGKNNETRRPYCKECTEDKYGAGYKAFARTHKELYRDLVKARSKRNPERCMLKAAKGRAKEKNIPFNITLEDIMIPEFCPVLNIPLVRSTDKHAMANSPTIDRIIPELGYVKGNVMVISHRANTLKNNSTINELEAVLKYMKIIIVIRG